MSLKPFSSQPNTSEPIINASLYKINDLSIMHAAVTDFVFRLKSTPYRAAHPTHKEKESPKTSKKENESCPCSGHEGLLGE